MEASNRVRVSEGFICHLLDLSAPPSYKHANRPGIPAKKRTATESRIPPLLPRLCEDLFWKATVSCGCTKGCRRRECRNLRHPDFGLFRRCSLDRFSGHYCGPSRHQLGDILVPTAKHEHARSTARILDSGREPLPQDSFGNCGSHPLLRATRRPDPDYLFTLPYRGSMSTFPHKSIFPLLKAILGRVQTFHTVTDANRAIFGVDRILAMDKADEGRNSAPALQ